MSGTIPKWLNGTLIRNGPGITKVGNEVYNHLLDILAVLHRYHIDDGKVTYSSRALESDAYKNNMAANRIIMPEFGTCGFPDPCKTLFQRLQSDFGAHLGTNSMTDNCNESVCYYGDQLYAMMETNAIRRIDPKTLRTIGDKTLISKYVAINHATAHPNVCEDGTIYNVGNNYLHKKGPHYVVVKIPPTLGRIETSYEGAEIVAEIPFTHKRYPSYYHSFAITKNKIVFIEAPLRMDLLKAAIGPFVKKSVSSAISWDPSVKTRFHVASLTDGKIHPVVYEADPFVAFHHINAYEEYGQIVVDVAAYDRADLSESSMKSLQNAFKSSARRFVLPLNVDTKANESQNLVTLKDCRATACVVTGSGSGTKPKVYLSPQHLTKEWIELPRYNYRYNASQYNYFYGISSLVKKTWSTTEPDSLTKVDIKNDKTICWSSTDEIPSEPIFVARPGATDEDDGVVLTALMDKHEEKRVTLLLLDAKDMTEMARVKFEICSAFTATFHGIWVNQTDRVHLF